MNNLKVIKSKKLQIAINDYIKHEYNMITDLNAAIKANTLDDFMASYDFRNFKVMEKNLEKARIKVLRYAKIMNNISTKYNTMYCDNDIFNCICDTLDENL